MRMIYVIGPMPPPVHGASAVTEKVDRLLRQSGFQVSTCSTGVVRKDSSVAYHLGRLRAYGTAAITVLTGRAGAVYQSLSGGAGLLYDLGVVAAARLRGRNIVFHHHSFAYINARSAVMALIVRLAGARGRHAVLCPTMGMGLDQRYGPGLAVEVVSNLAFFDLKDIAVVPRTRLGAIGYLSNISREKGIDRFLDLIKGLRERGSAVRAVIAGPIGDREVEAEVKARCAAIGGCDLVGPVYGAGKADFFASIDLFVFPSRYVNEAQPMVMFEALEAAVPVVGTQRGCMRDLPAGDAVILLDEQGSNVGDILDQLLAWEHDPTRFAVAAAAARDLRRELEDIGQDDRRRFLALMGQAASAHDEAHPPVAQRVNG